MILYQIILKCALIAGLRPAAGAQDSFLGSFYIEKNGGTGRSERGPSAFYPMLPVALRLFLDMQKEFIFCFFNKKIISTFA